MSANAKVSSQITGNQFHRFRFEVATLPKWNSDLTSFDDVISSRFAPNGVGETVLLRWFGTSIERIALLVYAIYGTVPTHVARELIIGDFRADFAWADVDPDVDPTVGLIELENCQPQTLFEKRARKAPYIGTRFLGGFSQLVDWCAFGQGQARRDATISNLLGERHENASYVFSLVAGDRRFNRDALSQQRLRWWREHISVGHGTRTVTFGQFLQLGASALKILQKTQGSAACSHGVNR